MGIRIASFTAQNLDRAGKGTAAVAPLSPPPSSSASPLWAKADTGTATRTPPVLPGWRRQRCRWPSLMALRRLSRGAQPTGCRTAIERPRHRPCRRRWHAAPSRRKGATAIPTVAELGRIRLQGGGSGRRERATNPPSTRPRRTAGRTLPPARPRPAKLDQTGMAHSSRARGGPGRTIHQRKNLRSISSKLGVGLAAAHARARGRIEAELEPSTRICAMRAASISGDQR